MLGKAAGVGELEGSRLGLLSIRSLHTTPVMSNYGILEIHFTAVQTPENNFSKSAKLK